MTQQVIAKTLDMMHALDNGATIDAAALALALKEWFGVDVADYGYHDDCPFIDAALLRADHEIVITRSADCDFVNLPIEGVSGILVSHHGDQHVWSLGVRTWALDNDDNVWTLGADESLSVLY